MNASSAATLGHIAGDLGWTSTSLIALLCLAGFATLLMIESSWVKHGGLRWRSLATPVSAVVAVALAAVIAPTPGFAQDPTRPTGLPDLISDPPYIWNTRTVRTQIGDEQIRVMAFDGYIHNIGTGDLRVEGNPQLDDGMRQLVFDGTEWNDVGSPTVRFETDDGHNHFHLMRAVDYTLWDNGRNSAVTDASKVGFCLVDTEVREEGVDAIYMIDDFNYCEVDNPDATELTMGISSGWRDVYDANVTLQWVDISDVEPGSYWVSAETDVNDEIVESDETNNGIVFSANSFEADGHVARDLTVTASEEPIRLRTRTYGDTGRVAFVITDGPSHGTVDVPLGVDLASDQVLYRPDPGFVGIDTFTYFAHDVSSAYPRQPTPATVSIEVTADATSATFDDASDGDGAEPNEGPSIAGGQSQESALYQPVEVPFTLDRAGDTGDTADPPRWYAADLPAGLAIDIDTGVVTGTPTTDATYASRIVAVGTDWRSEYDVEWLVTKAPVPSLLGPNDFSSVALRLVRYPIGGGTVGARYTATGLPEGTLVVENVPLLTGVPRELGDFRVVVDEIVDDEVVSTVEFTWTIRPAARPEFPF